MGVGTSKTQNNETIVPLTKSEMKPVFELDSGDFKKMRQKLRNLIQYHSANYQAYLLLKNIDFKCKKNNDTLSALIDMSKKDKQLATYQTQIKYLYDTGAIYFDVSKSNQCSLKSYIGFDSIYTLFIDNLKFLETIELNGIQVTEAVQVDVTSFQKEIQDNIKLITTHIIYYSFSIVYNNFLMSLYVMYAKKQFAVIDKTFRRIQRENQLRIVREKLNVQMKQVRGELSKMNSESTMQFNTRISELTAFFQKKQHEARKSFVPGNVNHRVGGSGFPPMLDALNQIHAKKFKEYKQSNKTLTTFFTMINSIIIQKTNKKVEKYLNTDFDTTIVSPELRDTINDIILKMRTIDTKNLTRDNMRGMNGTEINNIIAKNNIVTDAYTKSELAKHDDLVKDLLDFKEIQTNTVAMQNQLLQDDRLLNQ